MHSPITNSPHVTNPKETFKLLETYPINQSCFIRSYLKLSRAYSCISKTPKSAKLSNVYL